MHFLDCFIGKLLNYHYVLSPLAMFKNFNFHSPVAMLSIHTYATIEAWVSGIRSAGLMGLLSSLAGAQGCRFHRYRHKTHGPTIHHGGCVPHIQNVGAAPRADTLWAGTLVHSDLGHADLQERLELERGRKTEVQIRGWSKISVLLWQ